MAEVFAAARDYLNERPDCGPLALWSFLPASDADLIAVTVAHDV